MKRTCTIFNSDLFKLLDIDPQDQVSMPHVTQLDTYWLLG